MSVPAAFESKPSLKYAAAIGLQAGAVGAFVSAIQNALGTHSHGAMGFVTRTGGTVGFFGSCFLLYYYCGKNAELIYETVAAMGATFALTEAVVSNQRQTNDALNGAAGACAAGFLAGIRGL